MHSDRQQIEQAALDELLCAWHEWQRSYKPARGYPGRCSSTTGYRSSEVHSAENGSTDAMLENAEMVTVEFQVSEMIEPHRVSIYAMARNLWVGNAVFRSPREPVDDIKRAFQRSQARDALIVRLRNAGINL